MRLRPLAAMLGTAAVLWPAVARATPPSPFGHACAPAADVMFCPTRTLEQRVPAFDAVPLDVDVTLPSTGDGPFPTLVLLHGYGGSKLDSEAADASGADRPALARNNNLYFAQQGYAVVTLSARGFGRSCGKAESRTAPDCDRGWIHLADQRYEARDTQELLGRLVDEGIADPAHLGVTGGSYGGGQALELAYLKDRIRLPNGDYVPWTSPAGTPLHIAASAPVTPWSDLASALAPNGRFTDDQPYRRSTDSRPVGVPIRSYINGLYTSGNLTGFVAQPGADPSSDLATWRDRADRGEPEDTSAKAIVGELQRFHSALSIPGTPAPLLIANGWNDDLFGVGQALRVYNQLRGRGISLLLGDFGQSRGTNKPSTLALGADRRDAFFAAQLLGRGTAPADGSVEATLTTCSAAASDVGPYSAASWKALHPRALTIGGGRRAQTIRSTGGDPALGRAFDPLTTTDACKTVADEKPRGDAYYELRSPGVTLLGLTTITATVATRNRYGQIAGRLWDVDRRARTMRLVDRGVLRLRDREHARLRWQLHGQGYRFGAGHTIRLQLSGSDAGYLRPSNGPGFTVRLTKVNVTLPEAAR